MKMLSIWKWSFGCWIQGQKEQEGLERQTAEVSHEHMTKRNQNDFFSLILWKNDFQTANRDLRQVRLCREQIGKVCLNALKSLGPDVEISRTDGERQATRKLVLYRTKSMFNPDNQKRDPAQGGTNADVESSAIPIETTTKSHLTYVISAIKRMGWHHKSWAGDLNKRVHTCWISYQFIYQGLYYSLNVQCSSWVHVVLIMKGCRYFRAMVELKKVGHRKCAFEGYMGSLNPPFFCENPLLPLSCGPAVGCSVCLTKYPGTMEPARPALLKPWASQIIPLLSCSLCSCGQG